MDGAAERVANLVERILPDRPYHLSISPTERHAAPAGFWQDNSRLQYSTYVSGADRGVLLTRPHYDILEEPKAAVGSASANALTSRPDAKKTINKMSFRDYQQNKQKKLSESPPDTGSSANTDQRQAQAPQSRMAKEGAPVKEANGEQNHVLNRERYC